MLSHLWQGFMFFIIALGWLCLISVVSATLFVLFGKLGVRINDWNDEKDRMAGTNGDDRRHLRSVDESDSESGQ